MEEDTTVLEKKNKEKEEVYKVKKRTANLLPEADENTEKLQVRIS